MLETASREELDRAQREMVRYQRSARQATPEELHAAHCRQIYEEAQILREQEEAERADEAHALQKSKDEMANAVAEMNQDREDLERLRENKAAMMSETASDVVDYINIDGSEPLIPFRSLGLFAEANAASTIANAADKQVISAGHALALNKRCAVLPAGDVSGVDYQSAYEKAVGAVAIFQMVYDICVKDAEQARAEAVRASCAFRASLAQSDKTVTIDAEDVSLAASSVIPLV
jgi:hypothetical protein